MIFVLARLYPSFLWFEFEISAFSPAFTLFLWYTCTYCIGVTMQYLLPFTKVWNGQTTGCGMGKSIISALGSGIPKPGGGEAIVTIVRWSSCLCVCMPSSTSCTAHAQSSTKPPSPRSTTHTSNHPAPRHHAPKATRRLPHAASPRLSNRLLLLLCGIQYVAHRHVDTLLSFVHTAVTDSAHRPLQTE